MRVKLWDLDSTSLNLPTRFEQARRSMVVPFLHNMRRGIALQWDNNKLVLYLRVYGGLPIRYRMVTALQRLTMMN